MVEVKAQPCTAQLLPHGCYGSASSSAVSPCASAASLSSAIDVVVELDPLPSVVSESAIRRDSILNRKNC